MGKHIYLVFSCVLILAIACDAPADSADPNGFALDNWAEVEAAGRNQPVTMMMWQGDPQINAYMSDYVVPQLKTRYGIDLNIVSGQGSQITQTLRTELEAGRDQSEIDMVWINGETFFQLRRLKALYGPFTDALPNARHIDFDNPFIGTDFQQPIDGYECPWGNVQMCWIYDSTRTSNPPRTLEALAGWVKAQPGQFTLPTEFTGMTLLKSWLIDFAGGEDALAGDFDETAYERASDSLWNYINKIKPHFWRNGETFPADLASLHRMFTNGEVAFTFSNNDSEVDNKVLRGTFPETARAFVPKTGSIQNSHYLGIIRNAAQPAAALLTINFMISPEAQLHKYNPRVWGDGTVLELQTLSDSLRRAFREVPERRYAPPRSIIQERALQELAPEYMIRLYEDFRTEVVGA